MFRGACIVIGRALYHLCRLPIQQAGQVSNAPHQAAIHADRTDRAIAQTGPLAAGLLLAVQGMGKFSSGQEVAPGSNCGQSGRDLDFGRVKECLHHSHHCAGFIAVDARLVIVKFTHLFNAWSGGHKAVYATPSSD